MNSNGQRSPNENGHWRSDPEVLVRIVREEMRQAVKAAIADHHRNGNPVAIWRDGRVVLLYPDGSIRPVDEPDSAAAAE